MIVFPWCGSFDQGGPAREVLQMALADEGGAIAGIA